MLVTPNFHPLSLRERVRVRKIGGKGDGRSYWLVRYLNNSKP
jgi:hypothetical protein